MNYCLKNVGKVKVKRRKGLKSMYDTIVKKEEKLFSIANKDNTIILEGDIAHAGAEKVLDEYFNGLAEKSYAKLIIDIRRLSFINLSAIKSIIRFIVNKESINVLFIVSKHKEWQKSALSAVLSLGNVGLASEE